MVTAFIKKSVKQQLQMSLRFQVYKKMEKTMKILCTEMENMSLTLTLPIARRPLSKNISIPMNKNAIPNPAKPTPISERENPIYT